MPAHTPIKPSLSVRHSYTVDSPIQPAVLDNMGLPAGTRNSSGDVGNYSLKWRLLPPVVLLKYSLNNRTNRINMVIDYQK